MGGKEQKYVCMYHCHSSYVLCTFIYNLPAWFDNNVSLRLGPLTPENTLNIVVLSPPSPVSEHKRKVSKKKTKKNNNLPQCPPAMMFAPREVLGLVE